RRRATWATGAATTTHRSPTSFASRWLRCQGMSWSRASTGPQAEPTLPAFDDLPAILKLVGGRGHSSDPGSAITGSTRPDGALRTGDEPSRGLSARPVHAFRPMIDVLMC